MERGAARVEGEPMTNAVVLDLIVIGLLLLLLISGRRCPEARATSAIRWTLNGVSFEGRNVRMNLRESQKVSGKYIGHKPDGSIGAIDGPVIITLDPPDSLVVVVGPDGSGEFELLGKPTSVAVPIAVKVAPDVDPDPNVQVFLPVEGAVLLLPDVSTSGELQFGEPTQQ